MGRIESESFTPVGAEVNNLSSRSLTSEVQDEVLHNQDAQETIA